MKRRHWRFWLGVMLVAKLASGTNEAHADGVFIGEHASGFSGSSTRYLGHAGGATSATRHQSTAWWSTSIPYTECTGSVVLSSGPGAGKSWTISMNYNESATSAAHTCGTDLTPYVNTGALCTISGTDRNCSFTVDLTTMNGGTGIAANSCLQLQADGSGTPGGTGVITWDVSCGPGGASVISSRGDANPLPAGPFYCGSGLDVPENCETTPTAATHIVNWSSSAINACEGWFSLIPAPVPTPNGSSWNVDVQVSTAAVTAGQNCNDLTYTSLTGCSIGSTSRSCATGSIAGCSVPASGGCYRYGVDKSGTVRTTTDQKFNLDVSDGQGAAWTLSRSGTWGGGAATVRYLGSSTGGSSTAQNGYAVVPFNLTGCDGGFMQTTVMAGGNQADLSIEYSTAALAAGNKCSSLTYTSTGTLCTVTAGNKSCTFSAASVPAVAGGCMRLIYTPSGTGGAAETVWGWHCR